MKLVKPGFEVLEQAPELKGLLSHIERCARTCYKSEGKITEDSAEEMVNRLVKSGHGAMLEHGTVYLRIPSYIYEKEPVYFNSKQKYKLNPYSVVNSVLEEDSFYPILYVTTNYRVLVENDWLDDLKYLCLPTEHHEKRISVKFTCDRGVSHKQFVA